MSPCVGLCRLDERRYCLGCRRHVDEISRWGLLSDDERRRILRQIETRRQAAPHASQESPS